MHDCLALSAAREGSICLIKRTALLSSIFFQPHFSVSLLRPPFHALVPSDYFPFSPITP